MKSNFTVPLTKIIKEFSLETLYVPENLDELVISSNEVNRPGLQMAGYFEFFDEKRIQIIGKAEESYLENLEPQKAENRMRELFSHKPCAVVVCRNLEISDKFVELAREFSVPLFRTENPTSSFASALIAFLNLNLAPRVTRHGVLVEVYGEGILLLGESGVGKSETAIELVKRGHRLIADDAVEIKRVSATTLVGRAPEIIRHYVELRGVGIVDVRRLFGMGAVKETEKIDLVINLENWKDGKMYDRLGLEESTMDLLGIKVPMIVLPVCPGRNLSVVIEVAAMNNRQKRMGYNTAEEFNKRLMESMGMK